MRFRGIHITIGIAHFAVLFVLSALSARADAQAPCTTHDPAETTAEEPVMTAPRSDAGSVTETQVLQPTQAADVRADIARVRFNELLPDPVGTDAQGEFIEIANDGAANADLHGWKIVDAKGRTYELAIVVPPGGNYSLLYAETKIPLPNGGGSLTLHGPGGEIADAVSYAEPVKEGSAYAWSQSGTWRWTTAPTPGTENHFPVSTPPLPAAPIPPETVAAPDAAPAAVEVATVPAVVDVIISELMPDPAGSDDTEWIELENRADLPAVLDGLSLDDMDGGSDPFSFKGLSVPARGRIVIRREVSKIALNNDGDTARLLSAGGIIDQVTYAAAQEGNSYARFGDEWSWTAQPTPGSENRRPVEATVAAPNEDVPQEPPMTNDGAGPPVDDARTEPTDIADIPSLDDDAPVILEGVVTLPPGVVAKTIMAIQQGTDGIFARVYGERPAIAAGTKVRLNGRLRRRGAEEWVAVPGKDVTVLGNAAVTFDRRALESVEDADASAAIETEGIVSSKGASMLTLADDAQRHEVRVLLMARGMSAAEEGDRALVRGVVRLQKGEPVIVASAVDVLAPAPPVESPETEKKAAAEPETEVRAPIVLSEQSQKRSVPWFTAAMLGIACAGGMLIWRKRRAAEALSWNDH